jgi:hypothetical protein
MSLKYVAEHAWSWMEEGHHWIPLWVTEHGEGREVKFHVTYPKGKGDKRRIFLNLKGPKRLAEMLGSWTNGGFVLQVTAWLPKIGKVRGFVDPQGDWHALRN